MMSENPVILYRAEPDNQGRVQYWFHCPGCKGSHAYTIPPWTFNGNMEKPTFRASLLCNPDHPPTRCHLFVTDGVIEYCGDCHHSLAGQKVPMVEWEGFGGDNY